MMDNVLITGISGGIGKRIAEILLLEGSLVIGVDLIMSDEIREIRKKNPDRLFLYEKDLTKSDELPGFIEKVVNENGPVGGFVHCAGFDKMVPLHMAKKEDIESLWRIHALAPMLMISAISKRRNHMENTSIVLITSQAAHEGAIGHSAYASAKGAIEGYLAPAAAELLEKGIRINEVCFGPVITPMSQLWMDKLTDEEMKKLKDSYPLGFGDVEDASQLICFLLSSKSRWIDGQIIVADGGHSVRKI